MSAPIRVGTCSWADESLSKHWYPPGLKAGERLPYYAERFDTVEVDSTYYRLPDEPMVSRWAERTPDGFVMHVKAFGVMTRHPVKVEQLPPYIVSKPSAFEYLEWAKEQLAGDELMVEFRHVSWLDDEHRDETLKFLEQLGATHVIVDSPRIEGAKNIAQTVFALTSPTLYVRFHGRNAGTWNKRGGGAQERFDHLYGEDELREWVAPLRELAGEAEQAYALMNTNKWNEGPGGQMIPQGAANALALRQVLDEAGVPVTGTPQKV